MKIRTRWLWITQTDRDGRWKLEDKLLTFHERRVSQALYPTSRREVKGELQ